MGQLLQTGAFLKEVINWSVLAYTREFRIAQTDKKEKFVAKFIKLEDNKRVKQKVFDLAESFRRHGKTVKNILKYQRFDYVIREDALSAAKQTN